jgi:hypothetical protein
MLSIRRWAGFIGAPEDYFIISIIRGYRLQLVTDRCHYCTTRFQYSRHMIKYFLPTPGILLRRFAWQFIS